MNITDEIELLYIYWITGPAPKRDTYRNAVTDPPCFGWQHAFVLRGEKRSTIFCPYTFTSYTVPNGCAEMMGSKPAKEYDPERYEKIFNSNWEQFQRFGFQRDYDTCTLFMRKLGWEVPAQIMTGGEEDTRKKGGKATGAKLLKPVKAESKRGKFLQWFLDGDNTRSVREAMAEFSMTRSNALSYLYMIQKDHGIGYILLGDMATITLPEGCTDPFSENQELLAKTDDKSEPAMKKETDDGQPRSSDDTGSLDEDGEDAWLK